MLPSSASLFLISAATIRAFSNRNSFGLHRHNSHGAFSLMEPRLNQVKMQQDLQLENGAVNGGDSKSTTSNINGHSGTSRPTDHQNTNQKKKTHKKPRILCLHGKSQSASIFYKKISGARRKLSRQYDLRFLDGPIILPKSEDDDATSEIGNSSVEVEPNDLSLAPRTWWLRSEDGTHTMVREALDYVYEHALSIPANSTADISTYDAIIGFSQGGTLATALACSGALPNLRAVITAGAPYIPDAFTQAKILGNEMRHDGEEVQSSIPMLHFAGANDTLVSVDWTRQLCEIGQNGKLIVHDQGHLFPTRSAMVQEMLDFLGDCLSEVPTSA